MVVKNSIWVCKQNIGKTVISGNQCHSMFFALNFVFDTQTNSKEHCIAMKQIIYKISRHREQDIYIIAKVFFLFLFQKNLDLRVILTLIEEKRKNIFNICQVLQRISKNF